VGVEGDAVDDRGNEAGLGNTVPPSLNGRFVPMNGSVAMPWVGIGIGAFVMGLGLRRTRQAIRAGRTFRAAAKEDSGDRPAPHE
jgi:hypothetical protein